MKYFDLIIIGTGGGTKLRGAADIGKKVAIIEKDELGGTCLNKGCIPSKMLIYPADLLTHVREDGKKLHISGLKNPRLDFKKLVEETTRTIKENSQSIQPHYDAHPNITFFAGHARFVENKVIEVNGEKITAEKIYIATGSQPQIPNIPGLEGTPYMTSKQALRNSDIPKKMIVIGGGYIAVELGHAYGTAGSEVHFLVRSSMIKAEDKDIREVFEKDFSKRYNVHFGVSPTQIEYREKEFFVTLQHKNGKQEVMQADALFVATGVVPNTQYLGLENTDIRTNPRGYIQVNEYLETSAPGVYALGDVVGNYLFRHSVNYEGEYLFFEHFMKPHLSSLESIERAGEEPKEICYPPVPHAIFSYPQIAGVGVTEDELLKIGKIEGKDYEVGLNHYKDSAMGMASKPDIGLVKLIAEKNTGKILGAHIIGEKASDIIHMMIVLISAEETVDFMLEKMIFIHPALSEVIRNAARKLKQKL